MRHGLGRLIVAAYAIFALSATARAGYQIVTMFDRAPLAYGLSAFAAVVYCVATVSIARASTASRRVALVAVGIELVGVVSVGVATLVDSQDFPDATVWSGFGSGYGYLPLVLPVVGLLYLLRSRRHPA